MTLLQAMERTDWSWRVTDVLSRGGYTYPAVFFMAIGQEPPPKDICGVCDNEFCGDDVVVVENDDRSVPHIFVDVGPVCARDIKRGCHR